MDYRIYQIWDNRLRNNNKYKLAIDLHKNSTITLI
jgi:hypothetical protein